MRIVTKAIHQTFVLVSGEAKQKQQGIAEQICNSILAPEFKSRSEAMLEQISPSAVFDGPNLIEKDM